MWFYRHSPYHSHEGGETNAGELPPRGWTAPFVHVQRRFERAFSIFREGYRHLLGAALARRGFFTIVILAFCAVTFLLVPQLGQDFFPEVDGGQFRLHMRARSGTRIEETVRLVEKVEQTIRDVVPPGEISGILDNIGIPFSGIALSYSNSGVIGTGDADILVSLAHDHRPTREYVRELRLRLNREYPGTMFYFLPADIVSQTLNLGLPAPFDIQLYGRDQVASRAVAARLADKIRRVPGAVDVRVQQPADQPRFSVNVNREKSLELGLSEREIANAVLLSLSGSGQVQPTYWLNPKLGIQYTINIRAPEYVMNSISALESVPVSGGSAGEANGQLLANVADIERGQMPTVVSHYDVLPVIDVFGGASGRDLGSVVRDVTPLIEEAKKDLPRGSFILVRGQAETMQSSYLGLGLGLVVAIVLVYLLLVVNFQSWLDPLIIISALPGALAGVVWSLWITHTTLSVPALMGAIMSLGVATANAVLVVSFARTHFREGTEATAAALIAGATRLRAVLMTALAMIIGMLPMSLGLGEGGEQNAPIGRAVIGGLLFATVATLLFVPVVFSLCHHGRAPSPEPEIPDESPREPELAST
jgi:multidrug efflux pump subunit AcrB